MMNSSMEMEKYTDRNRLLREAISYVGHPTQSASQPNKIFLRLEPLSSHGEMLEFNTDDIVFAEEVETVSDIEGDTFQIFRIWIRIGSVGLKLEPFTV